MRTFMIPVDPYGDGRLYEHSKLTLFPGLTVLIGCNGSGKSTLMMLLKDKLKKNEKALVLSYDDRRDGGHNLMTKFGFLDRIDDLSCMMMSSEGERIHKGLEHFVSGMRHAIRKTEPDELWIFMDAVGSGLSIDGIQEIKDLANAISEDNEGKRDVYFIVSTNEYEFTIGADCVDVTTFGHVIFTEYDTYKEFILKTRAKKNKRIEKAAKRRKS